MIEVMTPGVQTDERATERGRATILVLGLWLGLVYGLLEGVEVSLLRLIPGALSWRTGNSAYVLWFAPLFYGAVFAGVASLIALLSLLARKLRWDAILVGVLFFLGAFLAITLPGRPLSDLAAAVLAMGLAVEATRQFSRHRVRITRVARRSLGYVAAAVLLIAAVTIGSARVRERMALAGLPALDKRPPNVLLLILDTQRADHLSLYGYARRTSPNLENFARDAVVFDNAYATSSWTLPTHASLMTGRPLHEHRAGVMRRPYLDRKYPTLAEALGRAGYATGGFVANTFWTGRQTGLARGFVRYEDFWGNPGDAFARTALGRRLSYDVLPKYGFIDVPGRKYAPEINQDVLRWIEGLKDRPFFAFVNYFDVHGPYLPPRPYAGTYAKLPEKKGREIDIGALTGDVVVPAPDQLQRMIDRYDESILFLDAELGRLFDELKARGVLDNTVVIITADHGESYGEHGMMYHGHSLYEEQLHVPLIIRYPRAVAGGVREQRPVSVQEIPATIAQLTGTAGGVFPGTSFFDSQSQRPVIAEVAQRSMVAANWPTSRGWLASLLTDRWQYTRSEWGEKHLFDLSADPQQERNLIADPASAETAAKLDAELTRGSSPQGLDWRK